jgi:hypothetical protein
MYRAGILVGLVCLAASLVQATPLCVAGSLEDYVALGADGCSVGDVTFSNFRFSAIPQFTIAPDPGAIQVSPDSTPILGNTLLATGGSGLDFAYNRVLLPEPHPATQSFTLPSLSMMISYDVSSPAGLDRATIAPQLSADPLATSAVLMTVDSAICAYADASQGLPGASGCGLGGTGDAHVVQNVRLLTGPAIGAGAAIGSIATRWDDRSEVPAGAPEPGTWMLLGLGLGLVAMGSRRVRRG